MSRVLDMLAASAVASLMLGCATDASPDTLVVRHPMKACALVWFSGCNAMAAPVVHDAPGDHDDHGDTDAGSELLR